VVDVATAPKHRVVPDSRREATAARGGTIVRVFWWGFYIRISHEDLEVILTSADVINTLVDTIGGSIPSPAQPWIKLLAPFVAAIHQKLRELDRGCGVDINMSWFAPGVFIPTPVNC
jgi:hypothetical protein